MVEPLCCRWREIFSFLDLVALITLNTEDRFKNFHELIHQDPFRHRQLILNCLNSAIEAVEPQNLVKDKLSADSGKLKVNGTDLSFNLSRFDKVIVVGAGKASGAMASAFEHLIPPGVEYSGFVIIPKNTEVHLHTSKIRLLEGSHPIPSLKSTTATLKVMKALSVATEKSLVVCLISGGGSALMASPAEGITLRDKIETTSLLLRSGGGIEKVNCVRKHLSSVKGGQLAKSANGAQVLSLMISDIVGNPLGSIASGPTVPDTTTFKDAIDILEEFSLTRKVPPRILKRLKNGADGKISETPKADDPTFKKVTNLIIGDNAVACRAATKELAMSGSKYNTYYLGSSWQGEAKDTASNLTRLFLQIRTERHGPGLKLPAAFVWGGETTVTVKGKGIGGRNQEEALASLIDMNSTPGVTIAYLGTDGVDGFTDAAGAIIDSELFAKSTTRKLNSQKFLKDNDSYSFFKRIGGGLLTTGPTGTNVNDIGIALVEVPMNSTAIDRERRVSPP